MSLKITGVGKGIPDKQITNDDLAAFLDTNDQWIYSRTGIKHRYVCTTETLTDLAATATRQAIDNSTVSADNIDLIICATISGDYSTPSLSCSVAEQVGIKCPAFDINAACTGFIYALEIASGFLDTGKAKNILIICAEMMSAMIDWNDRNTCILFGDGAAACVVTKGEGLKYINIDATADTEILFRQNGMGNSPYAAPFKENGFLNMQGQEVFKFAVNTVENEIKKACNKLQISGDKFDYYILHQANKRIIDSVRTKLKQPEEKFPVNIEKYGNLSSVSIPLLLYEMLQDGKIKTGDMLFMSAFGAGLTYGSCVMVWE